MDQCYLLTSGFRRTGILILLLLFIVPVHANAQDETIHLRKGTVTVGDMVRNIQEQTKYVFAFDKKTFDAGKTVVVENASYTVKDAVELMIRGTGYSYMIEDSYIVINSTSKKGIQLAAAQPVGNMSRQQDSAHTVSGARPGSTPETAARPTPNTNPAATPATGIKPETVSEPAAGSTATPAATQELAPTSAAMSAAAVAPAPAPESMAVSVAAATSEREKPVSASYPMYSTSDPYVKNRSSQPVVGIKTNLLYWATTTPNLAVEIGLGPKTTFDLQGSYNPWRFGSKADNKKLQHWLVMPEVRMWVYERYDGHFFGVHGLFGCYNAGGVKMPLDIFTKEFRDSRYEGYGVGIGFSYGYQWYLGPHWNLEATFGFGYAYLNYDRYDCRDCGKLREHSKKHYFGPTKVGVSFIYLFKSKK